MDVAFLNPGAQVANLRDALMAAVGRVLDRGAFILGPEVAAFESELAAWVGTEEAIGVNSGSDALTVALRALDVGPGDEVITSPFTYIAPAESVIQVGARLVFADIDPRTFCVDPAAVEAAWTSRTRALIPVHLFGQAAPMRRLMEWAGKKGVDVVEDCAQAIGATHDGQNVGTFGRVGCFSFYPTKNLGAMGDGGACVTGDAVLGKRLRQLRVHGVELRYHHDLHGYNTRLDELQAAMLRVKLPHVREWNGARARIAKMYRDGLAGLPLELPEVGEGNVSVWHVFALMCDERDALQAHLKDSGVPTLIYYPVPLHLQKCYADVGWREGEFPVAERVCRRILPLPMYPELTEGDVGRVVDGIRSFYGK